ncbi:transposase, partial [Shigella flexneri]|nr:transposase [Shigella flexneri]EFX2140769.1 transposase [Shigella flexneri]
MACDYRNKNRQYHCLSGSYMARSAKPRKRKPAPQRSKLLRYVVKLHEDDFFD